MRWLAALFGYLTEPDGRNLLGFKVQGQPGHDFWWHLARQPYPESEPVIEKPKPLPTMETPTPAEAEPEPEPNEELVLPPTREQVLSEMTIEHENNLAYIAMLPLDEDVREGLKNEAIDKYEQKVRKWLK